MGMLYHWLELNVRTLKVGTCAVGRFLYSALTAECMNKRLMAITGVWWIIVLFQHLLKDKPTTYPSFPTDNWN